MGGSVSTGLGALGSRMTTPRKLIMEVLRTARGHLSAEDIYLAVHRSHPSCGLTTVYRNLELLVRGGVVIRHEFGDRRARYELEQKHSWKEHHHHMVCRKCGKVFEFVEEKGTGLEMSDRAMAALASRHGFKVEGHEMVLKGLCGRCA